jgi:hypothetical protein
MAIAGTASSKPNHPKIALRASFSLSVDEL